MTAERWARVQALFEQALTQPHESRAEWAAVRADDPEMAALLGSMLRADATDRGELEGAVDAAIRAASGEAEGPRETRIGPYRIVSAIGQGGMGTVYLAERADGVFDQRVAIKVGRGLLDQERVRRFRAERQILASLQHPNIARLVDGGTTDDGWPYLVMEHVEGQAIDIYAEQCGLSLRERLTLFTIVCVAVGHAHRHLIVHRDIKPSNILVTDEGTPKLLDFGIAKLLDADDPDLSARTMTGMHMLTPDYAAPEQVRGDAVTTATDVYALGVLLFELVTSRRPHVFRTLTAQEIERVVCDTEAPRPSTVRAGLSDDLDIIIGTALSKDIGRRYASVEALVEDLRRFLAGRPIHARPATWRYRAARFVSRHRWEVAVAALFVVMLVAFSVLVSLQAARLARERDLAQQERDAAEEVAALLEDKGDVVAVEAMSRRALEIRRAALGEEHPAVARGMHNLARTLVALHRDPEAETLLLRALEIRRHALGASHVEVASSLGLLAQVLARTDRMEAALARSDEGLQMLRGLVAADHPSLATALVAHSRLLIEAGRQRLAVSAASEAVAIRRARLARGHPQIAQAEDVLAQARNAVRP